MKIITVVGARPNFIKAAPVSRVLRGRHNEIIVHTGQHYDYEMSKIFFDELEIPEPTYHLGVGSGSHAWQTGQMLVGVEKVLLDETPDVVIVYGDTNSTLAGALAAAKLNIPVAHVEAGLRSHNFKMPEEINRILTDRISAYLFTPTTAATDNLRREGMVNGVRQVGDVMYDSVLFNAALAERKSDVLTRLGLPSRQYLVATVHRAENTNDDVRLHSIFRALAGAGHQIVVPLHPRTRKSLGENHLPKSSSLRIIDPVSYYDMLMLEKHARAVITDSGGVQKEACFFGVPCITLRDETEWVETVDCGLNRLVGADTERILAAIEDALGSSVESGAARELYGDGHASEAIVGVLDR